MRRQAAQRPPVEGETTALGGVDAGQDVEERRLAGAIGADEAIDLAARNGEGNIVERLHAAEALRHAARLEECAHAARTVSSRLRTAEGSKPAGRKSITRTSASPKISM